MYGGAPDTHRQAACAPSLNGDPSSNHQRNQQMLSRPGEGSDNGSLKHAASGNDEPPQKRQRQAEEAQTSNVISQTGDAQQSTLPGFPSDSYARCLRVLESVERHPYNSHFNQASPQFNFSIIANHLKNLGKAPMEVRSLNGVYNTVTRLFQNFDAICPRTHPLWPVRQQLEQLFVMGWKQMGLDTLNQQQRPQSHAPGQSANQTGQSVSNGAAVAQNRDFPGQQSGPPQSQAEPPQLFQGSKPQAQPTYSAVGTSASITSRPPGNWPGMGHQPNQAQQQIERSNSPVIALPERNSAVGNRQQQFSAAGQQPPIQNSRPAAMDAQRMNFLQGQTGVQEDGALARSSMHGQPGIQGQPGSQELNPAMSGRRPQGWGVSGMGHANSMGQTDDSQRIQRQPQQPGTALNGQGQQSATLKRLITEAELQPRERLILEQAAELKRRRLLAEAAIKQAAVAFQRYQVCLQDLQKLQEALQAHQKLLSSEAKPDVKLEKDALNKGTTNVLVDANCLVHQPVEAPTKSSLEKEQQ